MKLALYFSHHESLGHTARVVSILEGLHHRFGKDIEIMVIHGGVKQDVFELEKYGRIVNLPFPVRNASCLDVESLIKKTVRRNIFSGIIKRRVKLMKEALSSFKPDIFMTEFFPFGRHSWYVEIPVILEFVRKKLNAKTVCSVGYPEMERDTYAGIRDFYDFIMFHCMKTDMKTYQKTLVENGLSYEGFAKILDDFSDRIFFTNYVLAKDNILPRDEIRRKLGISAEKKLVVVSRGGGTRKPDIIPAALAARRLIRGGNIAFLISTGPAAERGKIDLYSSLAGKMNGIRIADYFLNFMDYLNAADLSINMSGYNTSVELLWLKKQNICIPALNAGIKEFFKEKGISIEQLYRANMMEDVGISKKISPYEIGGKSLKAHILELLETPLKPNRKICRLRFNGIENTAKIIEKISLS